MGTVTRHGLIAALCLTLSLGACAKKASEPRQHHTDPLQTLDRDGGSAAAPEDTPLQEDLATPEPDPAMDDSGEATTVTEFSGAGEATGEAPPLSTGEAAPALTGKAADPDTRSAIQRTVENFWGALKSGDATLLIAQLPGEVSMATPEQLDAMRETFENPVIVAIAQKTSYTLDDVAVDGQHATVSYTIRTPETQALKELTQVRLMALMQEHGGQPPPGTVIPALEKAIQEATLPLETKHETMELILESGGWKIARPPKGGPLGDGPKESQRH